MSKSVNSTKGKFMLIVALIILLVVIPVGSFLRDSPRGITFPVPPPAPKPENYINGHMFEIHDVYEMLDGTTSAICSKCATKVSSDKDSRCPNCGIQIYWDRFYRKS